MRGSVLGMRGKGNCDSSALLQCSPATVQYQFILLAFFGNPDCVKVAEHFEDLYFDCDRDRNNGQPVVLTILWVSYASRSLGNRVLKRPLSDDSTPTTFRAPFLVIYHC